MYVNYFYFKTNAEPVYQLVLNDDRLSNRLLRLYDVLSNNQAKITLLKSQLRLGAILNRNLSSIRLDESLAHTYNNSASIRSVTHPSYKSFRKEAPVDHKEPCEDIAGSMARGLFQYQVQFEIREGNLARLDIEDVIASLRNSIFVARMQGAYLIAYGVLALNNEFSWLRADASANGSHISTNAAIARRVQALRALTAVWAANVAEQYQALASSNIYALESAAKHFTSLLLEIPKL